MHKGYWLVMYYGVDDTTLKQVLTLNPKEDIISIKEVRGGDIGRSYYVETQECFPSRMAGAIRGGNFI